MLSRKLIALALVSAWALAAQGPVYKLIYSPPGTSLGETNTMSEIEPGLFYALSVQSDPTIFSVTSAGAFKLIYTLSGANNNHAYTLAQGANGRLYGEGYSSAGTYYYSISTSGTGFQQYPFPTGPPPDQQWGSLNATIPAPPGQFYDLAETYSASTRIFGLAKILETGTITIVGQFPAGLGTPLENAPITLGPGGNIYGIAYGLPQDAEAIFIYSFTPAGVYSRLARIPIPGRQSGPTVWITAASDGNLYGTVPHNGANGAGAVFQATTSGALQFVANFPATGMHTPLTLFQAADGNLYGSTSNTASGGSWIFKYDLATQQLTQVYQLTGAQGTCQCQLQEGMDGKIYGITPRGGPYPGAGAIFSLDIGLPKPLPQVQGLYPAAGAVGQKVILWGNYLLGATAVSFNGTPATTFLSTSKQSVQATVPAGATTGPVIVTTANGSFTTTQSFTVQ